MIKWLVSQIQSPIPYGIPGGRYHVIMAGNNSSWSAPLLGLTTLAGKYTIKKVLVIYHFPPKSGSLSTLEHTKYRGDLIP